MRAGGIGRKALLFVVCGDLFTPGKMARDHEILRRDPDVRIAAPHKRPPDDRKRKGLGDKSDDRNALDL